MKSVLDTVGRWTARHPWRVIVGWILAVVATSGLSLISGASYHDDITAPGSHSEQALEQLRHSFPDAVNAEAYVIASWPDAVDAATMDAAAARALLLPDVRDARIETAADNRISRVIVHYRVGLADLDADAAVAELDAVADALRNAGANSAAAGGVVPESVQGPSGLVEILGVGVALIVLLAVFTSVWAAALPLFVAAAGLGVGLGLIGLLSAVVSLTSVSPTLASMIGLGVGIDYALIMVARYRQCLARGLSTEDAVATATGTAGRSVMFAGGCVLIGITGLALCGVPGFAWMGAATALVVLTTVAAALTLLPALLGLLGPRVFGRRVRRAGHLPLDSFRSARAERLIRRVIVRPVVWTVVCVVGLLMLAAPALQMRLAQNDAGSEPGGTPTRVAYDLLTDGFGAGANGPLVMVADLTGPESVDTDVVTAGLLGRPGVAAVSVVQISSDGAVGVFTVQPVTGPQDEQTEALVTELRSSVLPAGVEITGPTAAMLDLSEVLSDNLWRVVLAVLAASFLLLLLMFRSVVLSAKAVLVNLLSIGASYGLMTLAFQTDTGAALIGLSEPVPIAAWAPVVLFAILFGLSMDYEVFLLSAVSERHRQGERTTEAVVDGLSSTARIIVSAAAIMVAVAAGFALDPGVMIKIIGVGMVCALVLDVTVVRMILVPAAMTAMGSANWWSPRWLTRILPADSRVSVASESHIC
ncbi:MAG: MMPL family transporter [Nakamurella sp.]